MYKATINAWDEKRSYLILKKVFGNLSNGGTKERYQVVKRWSAQGYGVDGIFINSLKGIEYTKNELQNLIKL